MMGDTKQALKWYQVLLTKVPTDAMILSKVGRLWEREEDDQQALHYFTLSYQYMPENLDTITQLGLHYVKND